MAICWMPTVSSICQVATVKSSPVELKDVNAKICKAASAASVFAQVEFALKAFCVPAGQL
jgi:hypothetical protein